jgi:hypothetical protein
MCKMKSLVGRPRKFAGLIFFIMYISTVHCTIYKSSGLPCPWWGGATFPGPQHNADVSFSKYIISEVQLLVFVKNRFIGNLE